MSIKTQELQGQINLSDSSSPRSNPHRPSSESFATDSYSPRQSRFSFIEEDSEQGRVLSHEEKLNILKQKAPKFTNDLKFWPIFDTHILCRYSFVFFYYYELCLFLLKLLLLMTVLSIILYTMTTVVQIGGDHEAHLWLFFGLSLITIFVIRLYCMKEEKALLQDQNHPAEDWTENKFALLVQRLPVNATKDEIKQFFEKKIQENGYNDCVKKIMMLQECRKFVALEKKLRRKQYTSKKTIGNKQSLIEDIERVQEKINNLLASVDNYALYKGTAIIIFENIRGKIIIENYFGIGKFRRFFYSVLPTCFGKRYRFAGHIIKVKEAPEPSDLIFESVYISKTKIAFRRFLTYFLGNLAVFAGIGFIVIVRLNHNGDNMADWLNFPFYSYSAIIIGTAAVIYLFTDYLIEKIIINRTKSECEIEKIKFRLVISYLSINAYLVILMHFVPDFQIFQDQVFLTSILLAVFIPLRKFFSVISPRKLWLRRKLYRDPYCFEKYSQQEIINIFTDQEYDFANNVEDYVCFMFFALGFYFIGQLYIVVITLAGLILSICVDKLVMVRFTSPTKLKGSEMGLEFFRILRWDIRLQLLTIAFLPNTAFSADIPAALRITLLVFYGIFLIWDFRATPGKMWKRKWSKEREETQYDNVEKYFSHRYESEYPLKTF